MLRGTLQQVGLLPDERWHLEEVGFPASAGIVTLSFALSIKG